MVSRSDSARTCSATTTEMSRTIDGSRGTRLVPRIAVRDQPLDGVEVEFCDVDVVAAGESPSFRLRGQQLADDAYHFAADGARRRAAWLQERARRRGERQGQPQRLADALDRAPGVEEVDQPVAAGPVLGYRGTGEGEGDVVSLAAGGRDAGADLEQPDVAHVVAPVVGHALDEAGHAGTAASPRTSPRADRRAAPAADRRPHTARHRMR